MRKSIQRIISIVLALLILIPSVVMAQSNVIIDNIQNLSSVSSNITIDYVQKNDEVTISINSTRNRPVSITIKDGTTYCYINQGETDDLGNAVFKTTLELNKSYDCQAKVDDNIATKKIYMIDALNPGESKDIKVDLYIKGYNGVVLDSKGVEVFKNETLMDLMERILGDRMVVRNGNYIVSIDGQAEFDKGNGSGWMFSVNGTFPNVGANSILLNNGDVIRWLYTENLGADVGAPMYPTNSYTITTKEAPNKNAVTVIKLEADLISENISEATVTKDLLEKALIENVDIIEISFGKARIEISPSAIGMDMKDSIKIRLEKNNNETLIKLSRDGKELTELEKTIKIILPYSNAVNNKNNLTVILIAEDGTRRLMGGVYDSNTKSISFLSHRLGKFIIEENTVKFADLANYSWAEEAINSMAVKGIIGGKSSEKFAPADSITRAEFSALISRMLKYNENLGGSLSFKDVTADKWYYKSISAVYKNGLINGKSAISFDPSGNITREEMSKIIGLILSQNSYKKQDSKVLAKFSDVDTISQWAEEGAAIAVYNEIINGANGKFNPKANATRAEAAVMLFRLYDLIMK